MALNSAVIEKIGIAPADLEKQVAGEVCEIFGTMVGVEDISHLPQAVEPVDQLVNSYTAMVGLAGTFNGMVYLHAPKALAAAFTARMLGMDESEVDDDISDALGEIANMVGGSFKDHLSKGGDDVKLSTPSVVTGTYSISQGPPGETLSLLFKACGEEFVVSIVVEMG